MSGPFLALRVPCQLWATQNKQTMGGERLQEPKAALDPQLQEASASACFQRLSQLSEATGPLARPVGVCREGAGGSSRVPVQRCMETGSKGRPKQSSRAPGLCPRLRRAQPCPPSRSSQLLPGPWVLLALCFALQFVTHVAVSLLSDLHSGDSHPSSSCWDSVLIQGLTWCLCTAVELLRKEGNTAALPQTGTGHLLLQHEQMNVEITETRSWCPPAPVTSARKESTCPPHLHHFGPCSVLHI